MHVAAEAGHLRCVEALLAAGADLTARNGDGKTPIAMSRHPATRAAISAEATRRRNGTAASSAGGDGDGGGGGGGRGGGEREGERGDADARADGAARVGASRATRPAREWRAASTPPPIAVASSTAIDRGSPWGRSRSPVVGESFVPVVAPVAKQRGAVEYRSGSRRNPRRNAPAPHPQQAPRRPSMRGVPAGFLQRGRVEFAGDAAVRALVLPRVRGRDAGIGGEHAAVQVPAGPRDGEREPGPEGQRDDEGSHQAGGAQAVGRGTDAGQTGGVENGSTVEDESGLRPPGSPAAQLARRPTFAEVCSPIPR